MPEAVVAAIASALWVSTATATAILYTAMVLASFGVSANQRRRAARAARAAFNASLRDRNLTVRGTLEERDLVMGRVRKGGFWYPIGTTGADKEKLVFIVVMAGHRISAVNTVYFDEHPLTLDGSGYVTSAPFVGNNKISATANMTISSGSGSVVLPNAPVAGSVTVVVNLGQEGSADLTPTVTGSTVSVSGYGGYSGPATVSYQYTDGTRFARVRWMMGSDSQVAFADLITQFPTLWTANHRLRGCAYAVVELTYSQEIFPNGVPNFSADLNGADTVLDTRTSTTGYSQNPAMLARWYALHPMGGRRTTAQLDEASFIAAANVCDSSVNYGAGATALYQAGYVAKAGQVPAEVLDELTEAMAGRWGYTQGRVRVRAGAVATSVAAITSDWLLTRQMSTRAKRPRSELRNVLQGTFADSDNEFQVLQFARVVDGPAVTADGGELVGEVEFPAISRNGQAQQVAACMLRYERQALTVSLTLKMRAYPLQLFDVVSITIADLGWSSKLFEVIDRAFTLGGGVQVTFKEIESSIFAFGTSFPINDPALNTLLPDPRSVPTVGLPTVTSSVVVLLDGTVATRTQVTWAAIADAGVTQGGFVEVGYQDSRGGVFNVVRSDAIDAHTLVGLQSGVHYLIRARAVNGLGVRGDWSTQALHRVAGKTAAPANPSGFAATVSKGRVRWVWAEPQDVDYSNTEIRATNSGWGGAGALWVGRASEWLEVVTATGSLTRYIKHFDTTGNQSASSAFASLTVTSTDLVQDGANGANGTNGANGLSTALVYIYQRATSAPAVPSATATFTFSGASIAGLNNGWEATPPAGTSPLYVSVATASSNGATDTITSAEWASPVVLAANGANGSNGSNGANGADGLNAATVYLFQRTSSATAPSLPSATVTYTFSTGVASGVNNGWTQTLPTTGGAYRWVTTASALSSASTDNLASGEWAAASLLAQDGADGANGANGANGINGAPAVSSSLTRLLAAFTADSTGLIDASQSFTTTMAVMLGTADDTSNWTISRTSSDASITTTISGSTVTITGIGTSLETGTVTVTATRSGYPTQTIVVQVSKVKRAVPAAYPQAFAADVTNGIIINATANAYVRLNTNGTVETSLNNSGWTAAGNWYSPTTTGIGSSYRVANTLVGSALIAGDSPNYQALSSAKTYQLSQSPGGPGTYNEKRAQLTIRIAASGNDAPLAVGYATLYAYVDRT